MGRKRRRVQQECQHYRLRAENVARRREIDEIIFKTVTPCIFQVIDAPQKLVVEDVVEGGGELGHGRHERALVGSHLVLVVVLLAAPR